MFHRRASAVCVCVSPSVCVLTHSHERLGALEPVASYLATVCKPQWNLLLCVFRGKSVVGSEGQSYYSEVFNLLI